MPCMMAKWSDAVLIEGAQTYDCRAIVYAYPGATIQSGAVGPRDRNVIVEKRGLPVEPTRGLRIIVSGISFDVVSVGSDPSRLNWEIQGRM